MVKENKSKCSTISYIKVIDKMAYANSVDPDQTAPDQGLYCFAIPLYILRNNCIKGKILGHLPYFIMYVTLTLHKPSFPNPKSPILQCVPCPT